MAGDREMKGELSQDEALKRAKQFSEKYVERSPYAFFPEAEVVELVQQGLGENEVKHGYRYCP
ncbi:hypothetical protein FIM12_03340 [SAR202 cluster bacterium AD-804-J14_MRT_500m]|nr:hypothetical protein [SAR202 cluster bacterium AD-804-J14_MRT_500m]